jgi:hypothetical protein
MICVTGQPQKLSVQCLDSRLSLIRHNVLAKGTQKTYGSYLSKYYSFCTSLGVPPVPISQLNLGRYIAHLSNSLKYNSVVNYLSVIRILHLEAGYDNPLDTYFIRSTKSGVRRLLGDSSDSKLPITPSILLRLKPLLDFSLSLHRAFWAVCLVAFFSFFRKSNLLPQSQSSFDPSRQLTRDNVSFNGGGAVISVSWSKTIQYQNRTLTIPLPFIPSSPLCPSTALWLSMSASNPNLLSPFQYQSHGSYHILSYPSFVSLLRSFLDRLGYPSSLYSGHSFRRGGASFALESGASSELVQTQGDWRSDVYKLYIDPSFQARVQVASLMSKAILTHQF